jgi:hypothetical protein
MPRLDESARRKARAQEETWRRERDHNVAETRARFRDIATLLGLPDGVAAALVDASMEAARFYAMECAYANFELRTGCAYPPERRETEEAQEQTDWRRTLARLRTEVGED